MIIAAGASASLVWWAWLGWPSLSAWVGVERVYIWSLAVESIQANPTTGVGLGAFRMLAGPALQEGIAQPFLVVHAHNVFLQVALDVGVPGLIAYLALLGVRPTWHTRCFDAIPSPTSGHCAWGYGPTWSRSTSLAWPTQLLWARKLGSFCGGTSVSLPRSTTLPAAGGSQSFRGDRRSSHL